jgi:hypothetical protein
VPNEDYADTQVVAEAYVVVEGQHEIALCAGAATVVCIDSSLQ